jgi:hypothetical protein
MATPGLRTRVLRSNRWMASRPQHHVGPAGRRDRDPIAAVIGRLQSAAVANAPSSLIATGPSRTAAAPGLEGAQELTRRLGAEGRAAEVRWTTSRYKGVNELLLAQGRAAS